MGLGLAVSFVIFLGLAIALSWYTKNVLNGVVLIGLYAVIRIAWKGLTK